jgi:hypothetical protein
MPIANWRQYVEKRSTTWMLGNYFLRLLGVKALLLDASFEGYTQALTAPWPLEPDVTADKLALVGEERGMPRYPIETDDQYAQRLVGAWDAWKQAGNEAAIIAQLQAFGLSNIEIKTNADWNWDNDPTNWSRFWVVINEGGHPWDYRGWWGDGRAWGAGSVWGINATHEEVLSIRNIIQKWKPAQVINPWIIIVIDSTNWSGTPDGTWDDWRNRDTGAVYIDGKGQKPVIKATFTV